MASSSSSLSCEGEVKNHVYQLLDKPGPRGAYEARQVDGGLYVRVDMPGVAPKCVKIAKRGEARTVTFTGKAPLRWPVDNSEIRVYGGYVVLDRDPREIDVEVTVVNGSLRLFFPGADGVLHSLKSRIVNNKPLEKEFPRAKEHYNGETPVFPTQESYHINPFLLNGVEGVFEIKEVEMEGEERMFLRIDMPGIGEENYGMKVDGNRLIHGGVGIKDHRLDEGGRAYKGGVQWVCKCCKMKLRFTLMKDGVLRIMLRGSNTRNRLNNPNLFPGSTTRNGQNYAESPCYIGLLECKK